MSRKVLGSVLASIDGRREIIVVVLDDSLELEVLEVLKNIIGAFHLNIGGDAVQMHHYDHKKPIEQTEKT
jgi:hypothetical protein